MEPGRMVERLDAVVLSGGSAFGLASADGVMDWLAARDIGFETSAGRVPIVVGMCLFDLGEGDASVRPGASEGRAAAEEAVEGPVALGPVGVGTGASIGKWRGAEHARPGGLVGAVARSGEIVVGALVGLNASGDIDDGTTTRSILDGTFVPPEVTPFVENTTIGVVVTNAALTKVECHLVAQSAHDGYGRALVPAHTAGDGDAVVVAATGAVEAEVAAVRLLATAAVESAIRSLPDRP